MPRLFSLLTSIALIAAAHAGQDAAKPVDKTLTHEERSSEWLIAFEKLRTLPRPGELRTAGIAANIGDVIEITPEQQASIAAALKGFDAAMVQKAAQWETEMKALRADYEAKIVAALPEARRDAAQKALAFSHEQWTVPLEFEARLRAEFIAKKERAEDKKTPPEELAAYRKDFMSWIETQRTKAREKDAETVKNLKALLDPKEAERLSDFDKNKVVPPAPKKK